MACGTPVVTSNVSSMPEVAGDAALSIDPYDVTALAKALRTLLTDETLRETLVKRGFEQAARFTWKKAAVQLKLLYDEMLTT
jgi:glycosyltransferase involved in cell wall biosynthesis